MLDRIFDWCRENGTKYDLPTDMLGKAIRYALNQESVLTQKQKAARDAERGTLTQQSRSSALDSFTNR